ncbi:hypothetical protein CDAR_284371 [Caerostris darwini]|uniref:Uncharacterized protein n=1 Tax=Caerostris darwini TaxID=1538125 RepID=A0AAV4UPH8_9ARAC|nr:hypothetical protein CDAR_284371 [Caerostris darwini]
MLSSGPRRRSIICQIYDFHSSTHRQSLESIDMHEFWAMLRNDFPLYMSYTGQEFRAGWLESVALRKLAAWNDIWSDIFFG